MWALELQRILEQQPCVLVTVASIAGSAPRATGSRMLVTESGFQGSIGGGNLEYQAIATARHLIATSPANDQRQELYGLGPELNQCCGGAVTLLYEVYRHARLEWLEALAAAHTNKETVRLVTAIDRPQVAKWLVKADEPAPAELPPELVTELQPATTEDYPATTVVESGTGRYLLESVRHDRIPLFLFGAGHVGRAKAAGPIVSRIRKNSRPGSAGRSGGRRPACQSSLR